MSLTPVEIRHVKLARGVGGYKRKAVDHLLEEIVASFEEVWREREDLRDEVERLEGELSRHKDLETLLRNTLMSAERSADELKAQARREAALIVEEARLSAREITARAEGEREHVRGETRRLKALESEMRAQYRAFLVASLDRLEREPDERQAPGQAA